MSLMAKDQSFVGGTIERIESLMNDMFMLMGVFDNYEGGDFCTGLIFGKNGAKLLTQVA